MFIFAIWTYFQRNSGIGFESNHIHNDVMSEDKNAFLHDSHSKKYSANTVLDVCYGSYEECPENSLIVQPSNFSLTQIYSDYPSTSSIRFFLFRSNSDIFNFNFPHSLKANPELNILGCSQNFIYFRLLADDDFLLNFTTINFNGNIMPISTSPIKGNVINLLNLKLDQNHIKEINPQFSYALYTIVKPSLISQFLDNSITLSSAYWEYSAIPTLILYDELNITFSYKEELSGEVKQFNYDYSLIGGVVSLSFSEDTDPILIEYNHDHNFSNLIPLCVEFSGNLLRLDLTTNFELAKFFLRDSYYIDDVQRNFLKNIQQFFQFPKEQYFNPRITMIKGSYEILGDHKFMMPFELYVYCIEPNVNINVTIHGTNPYFYALNSYSFYQLNLHINLDAGQYLTFKFINFYQINAYANTNFLVQHQTSPGSTSYEPVIFCSPQLVVKPMTIVHLESDFNNSYGPYYNNIVGTGFHFHSTTYAKNLYFPYPFASSLHYITVDKNGDSMSAEPRVDIYLSKLYVEGEIQFLNELNSSFWALNDEVWPNDSIPNYSSLIGFRDRILKVKKFDCDFWKFRYMSFNSFFRKYLPSGAENQYSSIDVTCEPCSEDPSYTCSDIMFLTQPEWRTFNKTFKLTTGNICSIIFPYVGLIIIFVLLYIIYLSPKIKTE